MKELVTEISKGDYGLLTYTSRLALKHDEIEVFVAELKDHYKNKKTNLIDKLPEHIINQLK